MLVLTRAPGESIKAVFSRDEPLIKFKIVSVRGDKVRVGIEAPAELKLWRDELDAVREEADGTISFEVPIPAEPLDAALAGADA